MKKLQLITGFILVCLLSCSKNDEPAPNNNRTLQISVKDYQPPTIGNHYWGVYLNFNSKVTTSGSVKVDFDVFDRGAIYKHYSYKFPFTINNENTFIYNTKENSQIIGPEIRNLVIDSLTTSGDYAVTLIK